MALETVDIPAVEILSTGGPVKAIGSPPDGDFYTRDELVAIADAHHALGDELKAPIKIGHSDRQKLAENSGLTAGEMPALGWLDSASFRVEDQKGGVSKLIADAKAVPAKLAELMKAGAYRTRSSELRGYASQRTQRGYDWVVNGLALLGANVPAVQTLDDVYRLYERADIDRPDADVFVVRRDNAMPDGVKACSMNGVSGYTGGGACHIHDGSEAGMSAAMKKAVADAAKQRQNAAQVIWQPETSFHDLMDDLCELLNPGGATPSPFWVSDIALDLSACVVRSGDDIWVVPITVDGQGIPTVAPSSDWQAADDALVQVTNDLERKNRRPAESRLMQIELTDEQVTALRDKFGLAADADLTPEALVEAAETRANELATATTQLAELENGDGDETAEKVRKLEADLAAEQKRSFEQRRDMRLNEVMRTRELEPADLEKWHKRFNDLGEDVCNELLDELPKRENARELGSDGDNPDEQSDEQRRRLEAQAAEFFGHDPQEATV